MGRPLNFQRILFMTDFGSRARTAAIYALSLAQEFRSRVRLCHVHDDTDRVGNQADVRRLFESELGSFISADASDWCDPECSVGFGNLEENIARTLTEYAPDLVVLGAHSTGWLGDHGRPGVAFSVMAHAGCPVLSLAGQRTKSHSNLSPGHAELHVNA